MSDMQLLGDILRESIDVIFDKSYPEEFRNEIRSILMDIKEECKKTIIENE